MNQKIFLIGLIINILIFASVVEASAIFKVNIQSGSTDGDLTKETIRGIENYQGDNGWRKYWTTTQTVTTEGTSFTWLTANRTMYVYDGGYPWYTLDNPTTLTLTDDELSNTISLGFDTDFYGAIYNNVHISSNGFVTFTGTSHGCCQGQDLPDSTAPNDLIAGWWEDLNPETGGTIKYQTITILGQNWFVVEFNNIPHWPNVNPVTFQIVIGEKW